MRDNIWILVADSAAAKVFECRSGRKPPVGVFELRHDASRKPARELGTDRPGRIASSAATVGSRRSHASASIRHAFSPETDAHEHETLVFARQVAERLEGEYNRGSFGQLIVIASPRFLGRLRSCFKTNLTKAVRESLSRDWTGLPEKVLFSEIRTLVGSS